MKKGEIVLSKDTDRLAQAFQQALAEAVEQAQSQWDVRQKRLSQEILQKGALDTAKGIIKRGRPSEGFYALQLKGALSLSLEAVVVREEFGPLFTDEEVNHCMDLLCEYGYYG